MNDCDTGEDPDLEPRVALPVGAFRTIIPPPSRPSTAPAMSPSDSSGRHPSGRGPGRPLRLGALGTGRVFLHLHEPALRAHPRWHLTSVFDPSTESVREAATRVPGLRIARSPAELLDGGPEPLDGVLILSPPARHVEQALAAFERRIPVLVEKPMALDRSSADRLVAAWQGSGVPAQVGFNRRFRAPYRALRAAVEGSPGAIRRVRATFEADVDRWGEASGPEPLLHDLAVHLFDLVRWITGREFEEVSASTGRDGRVRVSGALTGGATVEIEVARRRGYREWVLVEGEDRSRFVHPGGALPGRLVPSRTRGLVAEAASVLESLRARARGGVGHTRRSLVDQLTAFADLVAPANGRPVVIGAGPVDGLRAVELTRAALRSLVEGTPQRPLPLETVPRAHEPSPGDSAA